MFIVNFNNKDFRSYKVAMQYFNAQSQRELPFCIFLIEDHEEDQYSVVSEGMLQHLQEEYFLDMTILMES
jgi:hypothetical protein